MEESDAPVQEVDEGNEGAFTRDWIEQMTASVSNIADRLNDVTDAIFEIQETSLALQNASQRTLQILEADSPPGAQADASQTSPVMRPPPVPQSPAPAIDAPSVATGRTATSYDLRLVHRIYGDSLHNIRVSKIPDYKFETAYMTWTRLINDVPVDAVHHRALMSLAFEGVALRAFEEIAAANPIATSEELWTLLRQRLCNESQIMSLRSSFMNMKWNEKKESVQAYATRLRNTAMNLPEAISEDMMVSRFTQRLPTRLRLSALGVQGAFDEVVSRVTLIAAEYKFDRESIAR